MCQVVENMFSFSTFLGPCYNTDVTVYIFAHLHMALCTEGNLLNT